jgi:hypothetical protein
MLVKCSIYAVYPAAFAKTAEKGFSARNSVIGGIILIIISLAIAADAFLF